MEKNANNPSAPNSNVGKNERKERSYSLERDTPHQQEGKRPDKSKKQFNIKVKQTPQIQSSKSSLSTNVDSMDNVESANIFQPKARPLQNDVKIPELGAQSQHAPKPQASAKIAKKKEEEEKWYQDQFKAIAVENAKNRKFAQMKMQAQYRPSTGMKQIAIVGPGP